MKIYKKCFLIFFVLMIFVSISSISAVDSDMDIAKSDLSDAAIVNEDIDDENNIQDSVAVDDDNDVAADEYDLDDSEVVGDSPMDVSASEDTTTTITSANSTSVNTPIEITAYVNSSKGGADGEVNLIIQNMASATILNITSRLRQGSFSYMWTPNTIGSYVITANYLGTSSYEPSSGTQNFEVTRGISPTQTTIKSANSTSVGTPINISGGVSTSGGAVDGNLVLLVKNLTSGAVVVNTTLTLNRGSFSYSWNPSVAGLYLITAKYLGTSSYASSSTSQNFEVTGGDLQPTETIIKSGNSTSVGKSITIYGDVASDGSPSGIVQLLIKKLTSGDIVVNESLTLEDDFSFSYTWTSNVAGLYLITANYLGNSEYEPSSTNQTFEVTGGGLQPTETAIESGNSTSVGNLFEIHGTVVDSDEGTPVDGNLLLLVKNLASGAIVVNQTLTLAADDGSFSYDWNPTDAGLYLITANYLGNSEYEPSSTSQNFEVTGGELQPTETTIKSANSTSVGTPIDITGNVDTPSGNTVDGNVQLLVKDLTSGVVIVNRNLTLNRGSFTYKWNPSVAGLYLITANYLGTSTYNASSVSQNFEVIGGALQPTETTITSGNSTSVGTPINITGNVSLLGPVPLTNVNVNVADVDGNVQLLIKNLASGAVVVNTTLTLDKGLFSYSWNPTDAGNYLITADYLGTSSYAISSTSQDFEVIGGVKDPTVTNITSGNSTSVGKAIKITGDVSTSGPVPLTNVNVADVDGNVQLLIKNLASGAVVVNTTLTLDKGLFSYSWNPTDAGNYLITADYLGTGSYDPSSASQNFEVKKGTDLKLIVKNVNMYYADGTKLVVKVVNSANVPQARVTVNVKINGKNHKLITNSKGLAYLAINLKPKTYKVVTTIPKTSVKKESTVTVKKWKKSLTKLTAKNLVKVYKTSKRFMVSLKYKNTPIAGQVITVKVLKYTYKIKTNSKGIASLGIHYKPGAYKAKVSINIAGVKLSKNAKIVVKKRA